MTRKILIFVLMILLYSCKKEVDKDAIYKDLKISSENPQPPYNQLKYKMIFPDTIQLNKPYEATIVFESDFDTIIEPIQYIEKIDTTRVRTIIFYQFEPIESSKKTKGNFVVKDSVFVPNKEFSVKNIVFKEKGAFTFCGLINDVIVFEFYDDRGKRDSVHIARRKQQIFKNVVVID